MFDTKGRVAALVGDFRAEIGSFRPFIEIEKCIALLVCVADEVSRYSVIDQRKKPDVFEGVSHLCHEQFPVSALVRKSQPVVNGRNGSAHG
jgi:hypothetical protein